MLQKRPIFVKPTVVKELILKLTYNYLNPNFYKQLQVTIDKTPCYDIPIAIMDTYSCRIVFKIAFFVPMHTAIVRTTKTDLCRCYEQPGNRIISF